MDAIDSESADMSNSRPAPVSDGGISPEINERVALGPDEGQEYKLVEVAGTSHAGSKTAAGHVRRTVRDCAEVLHTEYAGRAGSGNQVYLVTYRLSEQS
jgi:hypothetical protein